MDSRGNCGSQMVISRRVARNFFHLNAASLSTSRLTVVRCQIPREYVDMAGAGEYRHQSVAVPFLDAEIEIVGCQDGGSCWPPEAAGVNHLSINSYSNSH